VGGGGGGGGGGGKYGMAQLFEALSYKPEDSGSDFRWDYWDFSFT